MKNIFVALLLLTFTACQGNKTQKDSDAEIRKTATAADSVVTTIEELSQVEIDFLDSVKKTQKLIESKKDNK